MKKVTRFNWIWFLPWLCVLCSQYFCAQGSVVGVGAARPAAPAKGSHQGATFVDIPVYCWPHKVRTALHVPCCCNSSGESAEVRPLWYAPRSKGFYTGTVKNKIDRLETLVIFWGQKQVAAFTANMKLNSPQA